MRVFRVVLAFVLAASAALEAQAQINGGAPPDLEMAATIADAARRWELAEAIVASREEEAGRPLDPRYRGVLKARLSDVTAPRLEAALEDAVSQAALARVGDPTSDLVFTPVPPCRILDTRVSGGIMTAGTPRNFFVAGTSGFPAQGGTAGGCGVPFGPATGVFVNFVAVTPSGTGNLRAWAVASPQPGPPAASLLNYEPTLPALANGISVPICDLSVGGCPSDMRVQVNASNTHVVADVVGYFARVSEPRTTVVTYTTDATLAPPPTIAFLRNLGTFTKAVAASVIRATWHSQVRTFGSAGTQACLFQLRIDGTVPDGMALIANDLGFPLFSEGSNTHSSVTLSGRWSGLATGVHTISLWFRGSAPMCGENTGGYYPQVFVVEN